jgi:hypothetical protein
LIEFAYYVVINLTATHIFNRHVSLLIRGATDWSPLS